MASSNYKHPGVYFTVNQSVRKIPVVEDTSATVLFVPFVAKKGPTDRAVRCNSVSEFISTYGEADYSEQGQAVLNAMNWLTNGGAVLALRVFPTYSTSKFTATLAPNGYLSYLGTAYSDFGSYNDAGGDYILSKYQGSYYNDMTVTLTKTSLTSFNIFVYINSTLVESMYSVSSTGYKARLQSSEYIGTYSIDNFISDLSNTDDDGNYVLTTGSSRIFKVVSSLKVSGKYSGASIGDTYIDTSVTPSVTAEYTAEKYYKCFYNAINDALSDTLGVKADLVMDAGYSYEMKKVLVDAFASNDTAVRVRDDILLILDRYYIDSSDINTKPVLAEGLTELLSSADGYSVALYDQYLTVEDIYTADSGSTLYVTPTYFLSELIPSNDKVNHMGYTIMGRNRGTINKALSLNHNPTITEKDTLVEQGINYIEKDSRGMCFATQYTYDLSSATNTHAKKNINNVRVINKSIKDLEDIGRNYNGEMADATTIVNMQNAMNNYVLNWIQGRVLDNTSSVEVYADEYDNTVIHVGINYKFVGIVERIYIVINV